MRVFGVLLLSLLSGCEFIDVLLQPTGDTGQSDTPTEDSASPTTDTAPTEPAVPDYANAIRIQRVSFYQGVERPVWQDLSAPTGVDVPVIAERDALVRVFVRPLAAYEARRLRVHLSLLDETGTPTVELEQAMRVEGESTDTDVDSTFNFLLTGKDLTVDTELLVELREANKETKGAASGSLRTAFDSRTDLTGGLPIEEGEDITILVFPLRYNADGSGRLPDTSAFTMNALAQRVEAMYPVRSATVEVAAANDWSGQILANGQGFSDVLYALSNTRDAAKDEDPNTYYYALFNPANSFASFCGSSCTVGLSNLAYSANYPFLRASVGVGFTEYDIAGETLVHELGHAHGRYHAPCGGPAQVDGYYPYTGGGIGSWGYDQRSQTLLDPSDFTDMMGYCDPIWVSDYTFGSLWDRVAEVEARPRSMPRMVTRLRIEGDEVVGQDLVTLQGTSGAGLPVTVERFDADGVSQGRTHAWLMPYSHLAGGMVTLDEALPEGWTATVVK